ncbi:MAG: hypothetical protein MJZ25_10900 [Fibrobacter sp.]|nr:hypothetical protein [Fibrobacter sp.]
MNLKTKFIVLTAGLAAFAQAQDPQTANTAPVDTATVSAVPAETAVADSAATATTEAVATADTVATAEQSSTEIAQPTDAATDSTTTAEPVVPIPLPEPAPDSAVANAEVVNDSTASAPVATDSLAQGTVATDSAAVDTLAKTDASIKDSIISANVNESISDDSLAKLLAVHKDLNVLHGNAYNIVGNEAAASTIGGDLAMPHKMLGHRLGYFEPINGYGVASFGSDSRTYFLAFDNSNDLGLVSAGAAFGKIGGALRFAVGKNWSTTNVDITNTEEKLNETSSGTLFGGVVSANLLGFDMGLDLQFSNPSDQFYASNALAKVDVSVWDFEGKFTLANSNNSRFAWAFNLSFLRHQQKTSTTQVSYFVGADGKIYKSTIRTVETDTSSCVAVVPEFNFGSTVLESEKSRLYVGLNTAVPMVAYDRILGVVSRHNEYGVELAPNILGEVVLGKYVMAFGSASYQWNAVEISDAYKVNAGTKKYSTKSGTTTANLGMRLHTDYAALEMVFTNQFVKNPFSSFSNSDEIGFSIGAFINF